MQNNVIRIILTLTTVLTQLAFGADFTIRGRIYDAQTKAALPDANIIIEGTSQGTISDGAGRFNLTIRHSGTYTLHVNYIGYQPFRQSLKLTGNRLVELKIALIPDVLAGEGVTVTAKADANRAVERKTPVAFSSLELTEIRNNYTTGDLPELIQEIPGVWTSSAGLGETEIRVRGFTSDKVRFMLNDVPLNEPEDNQVYWSNWASLAATAHSIEVHRGPGFSLYGPAAFGGSVHIETLGVGTAPGSTFRVSGGIFRRMGISSGSVTGKVFNPEVPDELFDAESAINYTYSLRLNSGPRLNGKFNLSAFLEYKTGDSYLYGTTYDGFAFGLEAESRWSQHRLRFSFFMAPQAHNQAFALQDIDLLAPLGREYNRKNHSYQENAYAEPFFTLKHEWTLSDQQILVSNFFSSVGQGADQTLVNDVFDVATGTVRFQPVTTGKTLQAFGKHAAFLYENYGLWCTDFLPLNYEGDLNDPFNQHSYKTTSVGKVAVNLFSENHDHSWQKRNRRDHAQAGLYSYLKRDFSEQIQFIAGGEGRLWRGHREAEVWYLRFGPGINFRGTDVYWIVGDNIQTDQLQSIYNYDTEVNNLAAFARLNLNLLEDLTLQAGGQFSWTQMKVNENPIRMLDIGSFKFFTDSYRTSADQINPDGSPKFSTADYQRKYQLVTPWLGANYNLTGMLNLFANLATSQKEPAILDWYDFARGPLPVSSTANKLTPELARSFEIGMGFASDWLDSKLNYYHTQYRDKIESVTDINDQRRTLNAGHAVFQGVEWELRKKLQRFEFFGNATLARNRWTEMRVDSIFSAPAAEVIGKVVPFAPERLLSAGFNYHFPPEVTHSLFLKLQVNYWDRYFGTYTNDYTTAAGEVKPARLPYFLDVSGQIGVTKKLAKSDITFRVDANNVFNRRENYLRAAYTIDYTRNDALAGKYNWYVLQAPLFNLFFTAEVSFH